MRRKSRVQPEEWAIRNADGFTATTSSRMSSYQNASTASSEVGKLSDLLFQHTRSTQDIGDFLKATLELSSKVLGSPAVCHLTTGWGMPPGYDDLTLLQFTRCLKFLLAEMGWAPWKSSWQRKSQMAAHVNISLPKRIGVDSLSWIESYRGIYEDENGEEAAKMDGRGAGYFQLLDLMRGPDPHKLAYRAEDLGYAGRELLMVNTLVRLSLFPHVVPLAMAEQLAAHSENFHASLAELGMGAFILQFASDSAGVHRSRKPTPQLQQMLDDLRVGSCSKLAAFIEWTRVQVRAASKLPASYAAAYTQLSGLFMGFVPTCLLFVKDVVVLGYLAATIDVILNKKLQIPTELALMAVAVVCYSFNARYLVTVFTYLAARVSEQAEAAIADELRGSIARVNAHHARLEELKGHPQAAREYVSSRPTQHLPLPKTKRQLLLHIAAEYAQRKPLWPKGMLHAAQKHCTIDELGCITSVAMYGYVSVLEMFRPVLEPQPELVPAVRALHASGVFTEPLTYNPKYVNARHWESFYSRHPQVARMDRSCLACCNFRI